MTKKCKVLSYNPHINIVVVDYDGKPLQFTGTIDKNAETVFVKYENGMATVAKETDSKNSYKGDFEKSEKIVNADDKKDYGKFAKSEKNRYKNDNFSR